MKVGDLVRWSLWPQNGPAALGRLNEIGIVIDIGWTQNWIWVKWPSSDELTLARRDALVVQ